MYTIFKNDTSIILTDDRNITGNHDCYLWIDFNRKEALDKLISDGPSKLYLYDADLTGMWRSFKGLFKVIEASGGIVQNEEGDILFIYRNDKWDLPKGKIELNETREIAGIREVQEECGFKEIKLLDYIGTTYHLYSEKKEEVLKMSYWYKMYSNDKVLVPQLEEGITDLSWVSRTDVPELLQNTYPNIALLVEMYWPDNEQ